MGDFDFNLEPIESEESGSSGDETYLVPSSKAMAKTGGIANGGFVGDTGYAVVNEKQKKKSVDQEIADELTGANGHAMVPPEEETGEEKKKKKKKSSSKESQEELVEGDEAAAEKEAEEEEE